MDEQTSKPGLLDTINSRSAFWMGVGVGLAAVFTIGFFVLAYQYFTSDATAKTSANTNAAAVTTNTGSGSITVAPVTDKDWVRGNRKAKISVIEYSDIDCPYCQRFHPTLEQMMDEYGDQVNWVYRHFPLTSLHPNAFKKAVATECVGELGGNDAFWKFLDSVVDDNPSGPVSQLPELAAAAGVSQSKFESCLNSTKYDDAINTAIVAAQDAGGTGTPYSVIIAGDQVIPFSGAQPYASLKAQLDKLL